MMMPNINDSFPSNYIKAADLKGREVPVTIDRVEYEPVGQSREMKAVLYFKGKEKGLVLNKTNAKKIVALLNSALTEEWAGGRIMLFPTETEFAGETVDCIRIKAVNGTPGRNMPILPPVQKEPEPDVYRQPLTDDEIPF